MSRVIIAGIYSITSKVNGKQYIGSSIDIVRRWWGHLTNLKRNKHHSPHMQHHFNKHTIEALSFEVIEEVSDLNLLIEREQYYLDLLKPEFNCQPTAGSNLGHRRKGAKYYKHYEPENKYQVYYLVKGRPVLFHRHGTEEEAIAEVEYIKSLAAEDLIKYAEDVCTDRLNSLKNYHFNKQLNKWCVLFMRDGKSRHFGWYETEQEAIERVKYIRSLTEEQLTECYNQYQESLKGKNYCKARNKWRIVFKLKGKTLNLGYCDTEQEAIDKVSYIKTLSDDQLIDYHRQHRELMKEHKYYFFDKKIQKWAVLISIKGKPKRLGSYKTEQEAIDVAKYIKTLTEEQLIAYHQQHIKSNKKTKSTV